MKLYFKYVGEQTFSSFWTHQNDYAVVECAGLRTGTWIRRSKTLEGVDLGDYVAGISSMGEGG